MPSSAPRIPPRLLDVIERLARRELPIAQINRVAGGRAERMGLVRPSYEQVRVLVHEARRLRASQPTPAELAAALVLPVPTTEDFLRPLESRRRLRDRATPSK